MSTVPGMFKRVLAITSGVCFGLALALLGTQLGLRWGWWPQRDLDQAAARYRDVLSLVSENFVRDAGAAPDELTRAALKGMLQELDPHSDFLEVRDYQSLAEEIDGKFGGIGVQVEARQGKVLVIAPIAGTPGERAGIRRGDQIVAVDGESVERLAMDDVISRLRGKPGSPVEVTVLRLPGEERLALNIRREAIRVESVRDAHVMADGVGYIQLTQFSERTGVEFAAALDRLKADGARSLVLDLRNNPGGVLDAAVEVAAPFFRKGELIVYTQGRQADSREDYRAEYDGAWSDVPVAVLVNSGSASAAEIVTGALHDTQRAVVVGERSFGKGSVQSIFRLRDGEGVRLTTALYYTPAGVTIHERGIEPHLAIELSEEDETKLRLQRARNDLSDVKEFAERFGFEPIEDKQLAAAIAVLRGVELYSARTPPVSTEPPAVAGARSSFGG